MKALVLLSGGVDSSVALSLAKERYTEVVACYVKIWLQNEFVSLGECPWEEDLRYVHSVCEKEGVLLEVVSLQEEYWEVVVEYVIREVKAGRTPNPDVYCNAFIKFDMLFDKVSFSYDVVVTGHYAMVEEDAGNGVRLMAAKDVEKDQTYFLGFLKQQQIQKVYFPLGLLLKSQVRRLAQERGLVTFDRKDSQGICFLGKIKYRDFIRYHLGEKEGILIDVDTCEQVGVHRGHWFYTVGQRQGLGMSGGPWYVVTKQAEPNVVFVSRVVGRGNMSEFRVCECNWLREGNRDGVEGMESLTVKVRHGVQRHSCHLEADKSNGLGVFRVILQEEASGIAGGQFAVFYKGKECLGAGIIS